MSKLKQKDQVYFTAFLKRQKDLFYVCRGEIVEVPKKAERQSYRVKILAVGDRPVGGKESIKLGQCALINLIITKNYSELNKELNQFMEPPRWIILTKE